VKPRHDFLPALALFLFLALLAALVTYLSQRPLNPITSSALPTEFSAERAFRHVEALGRETRPVGTAAHVRARRLYCERAAVVRSQPANPGGHCR
jgi:hypothetical protein